MSDQYSTIDSFMANIFFPSSIPEPHHSDFDSINRDLLEAQQHMIEAVGYAEVIAMIIRNEVLPPPQPSISHTDGTLFGFPSYIDIRNIDHSLNATFEIGINHPRCSSSIEIIDLTNQTTVVINVSDDTNNSILIVDELGFDGTTILKREFVSTNNCNALYANINKAFDLLQSSVKELSLKHSGVKGLRSTLK